MPLKLVTGQGQQSLYAVDEVQVTAATQGERSESSSPIFLAPVFICNVQPVNGGGERNLSSPDGQRSGLQRASLKGDLPKYMDVTDGASEEHPLLGLQLHSCTSDYCPLPVTLGILTSFRCNKLDLQRYITKSSQLQRLRHIKLLSVLISRRMCIRLSRPGQMKTLSSSAFVSLTVSFCFMSSSIHLTWKISITPSSHHKQLPFYLSGKYSCCSFELPV